MAGKQPGKLTFRWHFGAGFTCRTRETVFVWHRLIVPMKSLSLRWSAPALLILTSAPVLMGQTWTQIELPPKGWLAIVSSANGSNIAAVTDGVIFNSTNSGRSWTTNSTPLLPWAGLACSADGSRLLAASGLSGASQFNFVLTSTNFGNSWTTSNVPLLSASESLTAAASSADGNTLVVVGSYGRIYLSSDGNSSWSVSTNASYGFFSTVACSTDGSKMAVIRENSSAGGPGRIWISTDRGKTWSQTTAPSLYWTALAFSAEGATLFACGFNFGSSTGLYSSTDDGASWSKVDMPEKAMQSLSVSADGRKIAISSRTVFTSSNAGTNWVTNSIPYPTEAWLTAMSADGGSLVVANPGSGRVYYSGTIQPPTISLKREPDANRLSWVIPSTSFALEQNTDPYWSDWLPVTNLPTLNLSNLHLEVTLPASGDNRFFRLKAASE